MSSIASVSIGNNFTSGNSGISYRAANDKLSGWIDKIFSLLVHPVMADRLNDFFNYVSPDGFQINVRMMLSRDNHSINTFRDSVFVLHCYLRFTVRTDIPELASFSD